MKVIKVNEREYEITVLKAYWKDFFRHYLISIVSDSYKKLFIREADLDTFGWFETEEDVINDAEWTIGEFINGILEESYDYNREVETEEEFDTIHEGWELLKRPFELYQD